MPSQLRKLRTTEATGAEYSETNPQPETTVTPSIDPFVHHLTARRGNESLRFSNGQLGVYYPPSAASESKLALCRRGITGGAFPTHRVHTQHLLCEGA